MAAWKLVHRQSWSPWLSCQPLPCSLPAFALASLEMAHKASLETERSLSALLCVPRKVSQQGHEQALLEWPLPLQAVIWVLLVLWKQAAIVQGGSDHSLQIKAWYVSPLSVSLMIYLKLGTSEGNRFI